MLIYHDKLAKISDSEFNVYINQNLISRASSVKYSGVFIVDKLTWTSQINQVALKLSKCNGIIYKLRNYVDSETLLMLRYSLGYSCIQYEITVWDPAAKSLLLKIEVKQINILKAISRSKKYCHVSKLYKSFELFKLQDIYQI